MRSFMRSFAHRTGRCGAPLRLGIPSALILRTLFCQSESFRGSDQNFGQHRRPRHRAGRDARRSGGSWAHTFREGAGRWQRKQPSCV